MCQVGTIIIQNKFYFKLYPPPKGIGKSSERFTFLGFTTLFQGDNAAGEGSRSTTDWFLEDIAKKETPENIMKAAVADLS